MRWDEMREKAEAKGVDWPPPATSGGRPMPESIETAYQQFVKVAKKKNITRLNERGEGYGALEEAVRRAKE
jgi:hypothetical protein